MVSFRTPRTRAGVLLVAAALAGCGGSRSSTSSSTPASTVQAYISALRTGDGQKGCSLLGPAEQQKLAGSTGSCEQGLTAASAVLAGALANARIGTVAQNGAQAQVTVVASGRTLSTLNLIQLGSTWTITSSQVRPAGGGAVGVTFPAPSVADVRAVVRCLRPSVGQITDVGPGSKGGVPYAVLRFGRAPGTVLVFASRAGAQADLPKLERQVPQGYTKPVLHGRGVFFYFSPASPNRRQVAIVDQVRAALGRAESCTT